MRFFPLVFVAYSLVVSFTAIRDRSVDVEKKLLGLFKNLHNLIKSDAYERDEKMERLNKKLFDKILYSTSHYPETINFSFHKIREKCVQILDSEDSNVRLYSWDTYLGGTMGVYGNIVQYKSEDTVFSEPLSNSFIFSNYDNFFCKSIFTFDTLGNTYYLIVKTSKYSSKDAAESVTAYTIEKGKLIKVKLFRSKKGIAHTVNLYYNFYSVVNRKERPIRLIKFNKKRKVLSLPIINKNDSVTKKYTHTAFNGQFFE